jgi:hypothetical protein
MDFLQALMAGIMSFLFGVVLPGFSQLFNPLWTACIGSVTIADELRQTQLIDHYLIERGYCSAINLTPLLPADGWHFACLGALLKSQVTGLVFVKRDTVSEPQSFSYTQYTFFIWRLRWVERQRRRASKPTHDILKDVLNGNPDEILVRYIEQSNPYSIHETTNYVALQGPPKPWQVQKTRQVMSLYRARRSASVFVSGVPGTGKSSLARYLAAAARQEDGVEPIVVCGASLVAQGGYLRRYIRCPTQGQPIFLVFNEFDRAVMKAEKDEEDGGRASSIAGSRTKLLDTLDMIPEIPWLIVVMTTNKPLDFFVENSDLDLEAYVRDGRFDFRWEV